MKAKNDWFTIDRIDADTYCISEYRHWEETHCYLLNGAERSLLIDTGLGICNILDEATGLTDRPVTAVATHIHWDHIGGHRYFPDFYAHEAEIGWLSGAFPQPPEAIQGYVAERLFPGHHALDIEPELRLRMRDALRELESEGKLRHGSGLFSYGDWAIQL